MNTNKCQDYIDKLNKDLKELNKSRDEMFDNEYTKQHWIILHNGILGMKFLFEKQLEWEKKNA